MFERTWRFRDIPGSMLVRVSVETLSSHPLACGVGTEEAAVHSPRGVIGESPRFKEAPSPTFSDGRGSGSSMPSPASSQTPPWTGTREKGTVLCGLLKRKRVSVWVGWVQGSLRRVPYHPPLLLLTSPFQISNQARKPAEFKHINKRRKRNQLGFP